MSLPAENVSRERKRYWIVALLVGCLVIYVVARQRWVGHMLTWDEAMNLCTVRALKAGGGDFSSDWFWRHPPLFCLMMLLLAPFKLGFAERVEWFAIGLGVINALLLFALSRRLFGVRVALWTVFCLAVLPGSVFFDTWVKRDHLATTFGLGALLLLTQGRAGFAGLTLGLALLSKETGIFYMGAAVLVALLRRGPGKSRDVAALVFVPALTAGWWFPFFGRVTQHLHFAAGAQDSWWAAWYYHLAKLDQNLEWPGITLALIGCGALLTVVRRMRPAEPAEAAASGHLTAAVRIWPIALLVPTYTLLSVLPSKVPWTIIVTFPAWATLQGLAISEVWRLMRKPYPMVRTIGLAGGFVLAASLLMRVYAVDYDLFLHDMDESQWRGARYSGQLADLLNDNVADGERVMLTTLDYWRGIPPLHPCPIIAYNYRRNTDIFLRPNTLTADEVLDDVRRLRIDWALLSPPPGPEATALFTQLVRELRVRPREGWGGLLFHTAGAYTNAPAAPPAP